MLPLDVTEYGKWIGYLIFFLIGMGFGVVLELAGFGDSRKLAAQFYFKDMTVLKTMFTGIIVACLLIFISAAFGILDFSKIFVNQTYLWPGIIGGLIMGCGFIIGGYCPGTSVVSAASFKVDGILFFLGTIIGVGFFGESVDSFSDFWNSSYTERLLLSDWFGWSIGATVVAVTILALIFFYGAEKTEEYFRHPLRKFSWKLSNARYVMGGLALLVFALIIWGKGQPDAEKKWQALGGQYQSTLDARDVFIHPLEYVKTWNDSSIKLITLDFRTKEAFDQFHLDSAKRVSLDDLIKDDFIFDLAQLPAQGVVVIVADEEAQAVKAWKWLKVQGVTNLYILENGLHDWNQIFSGIQIEHFNLSRPSAKVLEQFPKDSYKTKIKLKTNKRAVGLCS